MRNSKEYVGSAGWLDSNGEVKPDSNEGFRARWKERIDREGNNAFYDNAPQPEDFDTPNTATPSDTTIGESSTVAAPHTGTNTGKQKQNNRRGIADRINALLNGESYNQSDTEGAKQTAGSMSIETDGGQQNFSVEIGEFSDKYPDQKQYFGRYFNIKDEAGNIVARYSPYTKQLQMRDGYEHLKGQVEQQLKKNLRRYLDKGGFLDEYGRLKPDGNEEYRHKYRTRLDATPEGKVIHPNNQGRSEPKREDKRSFFRRIFDSATEKLAFQHVRRDIQSKIQKIFDDNNLISKEDAKYYSYLYAGRLQASAHAAGMKINDLYKVWGLKFQYELGNGIQRGNTTFNRAQYDENGNLVRPAETVVTLFGSIRTDWNGNKFIWIDADPSTLIHEGGHIFLDDLKELMKLENIPDNLRQAWETLTKWLGVSDIDLTKNINDFTEEELERWHNAQEQFAVAFEQYIAAGQAPKSWLKRAFEAFKKWMSTIYGAVRNIKYTGTDGYEHEIEILPEIKAVFDNLFEDTAFVPNPANAEARRARARVSGQGEEHYQTRNSQGNNETYNQPPLNGDVDLDRSVNVVKLKSTMPDVPFYQRIKAFSKSSQNEIISRFQNGQVVNQHTGLTITLSKQGLNHILDTSRNTVKQAGEVVYQAIAYLDDLARNAYRVETHGDRKPSATKVEGQQSNLKQVHRFLVPVELDGERHVLKLTAKEYETGQAEIDEVSLYDMKYTKKMSGYFSPNSPNPMGQAARTSSSPDAISVRDMLEGVNDAEGNPYTDIIAESYHPTEASQKRMDMDMLRFAKHSETFITPEQIERYSQPGRFHGTPNTIERNKFDLSKIGTGEGSQLYGYGIYIAENEDVARTYKRPDIRSASATLENGQKIDFVNGNWIADNLSEEGVAVLRNIFYMLHIDNTASFTEVKDKFRAYLKINIADARKNKLKRAVAAYKGQLEFLDTLTSFKLGEIKKSNLYNVDILADENTELLDWDADFDDQPEKIKKGIKKINKLLQSWGYPSINEAISKSGEEKALTGKSIYQYLETVFNERLRNGEKIEFKKSGAITRGDMGASFLLHQVGIPGLRYFDRGSRIDKNGTRNFVIWDMNKLKITGISEDSDKEAIDYFNKHKKKPKQAVESYNQTAINQDNEAQAWSENVDKVISGEINGAEHIKVMDTPKVFKLIHAKSLPIYMDAGKITSILNKHPAITSDIIKQIPTAVTDPIAIFHSATHPNDSIVVMTEIIDKDGGTVVVPVQLDVQQHNYQINRIASIYAKKNDKTGQVNNEWFVEQVNNGRLMYLNTKKGSQWNNLTGFQLPVGSYTENLKRSIPNETDLARLLHGENKTDNTNSKQPTHIRRTNDTLISEDEIEKYNQHAYQGTGQVVRGGFNLQFVGTGEGSQAYGYGLYFAENPDVSEHYRRFGLKDFGIAPVTITTKDGKSYSNAEEGFFHPTSDDLIWHVLGDIELYTEFEGLTNPDTIRQRVLRDYQNELATSDNSKITEEKIKILQDISDINIGKALNGNIYKVDIPENDVLLNWDTKEQPEKVQKAMDKIIKKLAGWGLDTKTLETAINGERFYKGLEKLLKPLVKKGKVRSKKFGTFNRADMAASMLLNQAGIPGLRYWDKLSRVDKKGSHNFVVWNTDLIKMLGISPDSDTDAIEAFKQDYGENGTESYYQMQQQQEQEFKRFMDTSENSFIAKEFNSAGKPLTEGAIKQVAQVRKKYQGTEQWLKAPNGENSNLDENQWLMVRTPNFKRWFGDWENHPENASKVVDANGEPLVAYHGTLHSDFSVFRTTGIGAFFTSNRLVSSSYAYDDNIYHVFINLRNPYIVNAHGSNWEYIKVGNSFMDTDEISKNVRSGVLGDNNHDGVIIRNVVDMGDSNGEDFDDDEEQSITEARKKFIGDDFIIFEPNHVKSATKNNGEFSEALEIYKQSVLKSDDFMLTPEAKRQMDDVRRKYQGTAQWMKAPNGKDTNLTEKQWLQVRTPNFKAWFGDWENNPEQASKVLDINGEPLVVYHGTNVLDINTFKRSEKGWLGPGIYLTPYKAYANDYLRGKKGVIMPLFINMRNPLLVTSTNPAIELLEKLYGKRANAIFDERYNEIHDRLAADFSRRLSNGEITSQIEQDFDRVIKRYIVNDEELQKLLSQGNYDGIAWLDDEELQELMAMPDYDGINYYNTEYSAQSSLQTKSATLNNGDFSNANQDIYHQTMRNDDTFDAAMVAEAKKQMEQVRRKYQGTDKWMKAPNGKKSNLNERQWVQVRTPLFKRWFGDWELDPKNASKVVDKNGEPLVVYRGSMEDNPIFRNSFEAGIGIFSTDNYDVANQFVFPREYGQLVTSVWNDDYDDYDDVTPGPIYDCFVNMRNPKIFEETIAQKITDDTAEQTRALKHALNEGYDGVILKDVKEGVEDFINSTSYIAFNSNQFKSATDNNGNFDTSNPNIYYQSAKPKNAMIDGIANALNDNAITLEELERTTPQEQLDAIRRQYEGTKQWMKAPNGKDTNLTEKQWLQVRTPNFKRWFGDWENSPDTASKVLDNNGEPLVVIHISRNGGEGYTIFNTYGDFSLDGDKSKGTGAWFADFKGKEKQSSEVSGHPIDIEGKEIYHVFLNLRNPFFYDAEGKRWQRVGKVWIEDTKTGKSLYHHHDGRAFSNLGWANGYINKYLDPYNEEQGRYKVKHETKFQTTDELVRAVRQGIVGNGNHDGVIIHNLRDMIVWGVDDYVIFTSNQVKSATMNNGEFSLNNDEIYKQSANTHNQNMYFSHNEGSSEQDNPINEAQSKVHQDLLRKYSNILNNANPDNVDFDNLSKGNDGFLSDVDIERYYQPALHGTGYKIKGNRMRLRNIGSGESGAMFGYGIYSAQVRGVAETYRRFGLPNPPVKMSVSFNDGSTYTTNPDFDYDDSRFWGLPYYDNEEVGEPDDEALWRVLSDIDSLVFDIINDTYKPLDVIKQELLDKWQKELKRYKRILEASSTGWSYAEYFIQRAEKAIDLINNISNFGVQELKGNIYDLDVPENEVLLNWDALLEEQPEHVKKAIEKIKDFIYSMASKYDLDIDELDNAKTGEDLYWAITSIMEQYLEDNNPDDGITRPDQRASMLFNRFGIPGHRYWDRESRDNADEQLKKYRSEHPEIDGHHAFSVATTKDGKTYTSKNTAWLAFWSNNPDRILQSVLNNLQHLISKGYSLQEAKQYTLEDYKIELKKAADSESYVIEDIQKHIQALDSITDFTFHPEVKPKKYNAFSLLGDKGTRNFVIWNEDAMKLLGIEPDSDPDAIDYFNKYKTEHPDGFINSDAIEQYDQLVTHATGNIIWNNRFDLAYKGSSEGTDNFGHGAYFEQNPNVAETYRKFGLKNGGFGDIHISTSNGDIFRSNGHHNWGKVNSDYIREVLTAIEDAVDDNRTFGKTPNTKRILRNIAKSYKEDLRLLQPKITQGLEALHNLKEGSGEYSALNDRINSIREVVQSIKEKLAFIKSIDDFSVEPNKKGNIYKFDIPEDYDLLNWDAALNNQSKKITPLIRQVVDTIINHPEKLLAFSFAQYAKNPKTAETKLLDIIKKLKSKYKGHYIDTYEWNTLQEARQIKRLLRYDDAVEDFRSQLFNSVLGNYKPFAPNSATGADLYWALADIIGSKEGASEWLNHLGIPGHYYWDAYSRGKQQGTHNYVIWNMDKIKMVSISDDSDQEAKDYFYKTKAEQEKQNTPTPESYNQIIGVDGARRLDEQEGITTRMDNLNVAKKMEKSGKSQKQLWLATGWMRGKDHKWRYEIPDGKLKLSKLREYLKLDSKIEAIYQKMDDDPNYIPSSSEEDLINYNASIDNFFDAPELFAAYPQLRNIVTFWADLGGAAAMYSPGQHVIDIDRSTTSAKELRVSIIHELQHAIQEIEGFADGSDIDETKDSQYVKANRKFQTILDSLKPDLRNKINDIFNAKTVEEIRSLVSALTPEEKKIFDKVSAAYIKRGDRFDTLYSRYERHAGEVEARNTEKRSNWGEKRRRATPLDETEDIARDNQIVGRILPKWKSSNHSKSNNSFVSDELIEHYNQLAYHGSHNIINDNRFNLKYIGTGEGSQAFGYGIYLAQNKDVAKSYRTTGMPYDEAAPLAYKSDNGNINILSNDDLYNRIASADRSLPNRLSGIINVDTLSDIVLKSASSSFDIHHVLQEVKNYIDTLNLQDTDDKKLIFDKIKDALPNEIIPNPYHRKGNLYSADIPEDFELLDWDADMKHQPKEVLDKLKRAGLYEHDNETGEELYRRLQGELGGEKQASMKLNDAGIPGHRYFDTFSRDNQSGSHNFVIWNTDTLHLLGLSEDSDEDAQDYFRAQDYYDSYLDSLDNDSDVTEYGRDDENFRIDTQGREALDALDNQPESYNQVIGEQGARSLDELDENTIRSDNLNIARQMMSEGKDAKTIRLATGWEMGHEGKWKYEIMDGDINPDFIKDNELQGSIHHTYHLQDIFDAPEIFKAYPQLMNLTTRFNMSGQGTYFDSEVNELFVENGMSSNTARSAITHEIQHAIQHIEGFSIGASSGTYYGRWGHYDTVPSGKLTWRNWDRKAKSIWHSLSPSRQGYWGYVVRKINENNGYDIYNIIDEYLPVNERSSFKDWYEARINAREGRQFGEPVISPYEAYRNTAGEVEARNTENRINMSSDERRNSTLAETEDTQPPEKQIIRRFDDNGRETFGKTEQSTQEQYLQNGHWHKPDYSSTLQNVLNAASSDKDREQILQDFKLGEYSPIAKDFDSTGGAKTEEAKKQLEAVRKKYQGSDKWLKAPNGKKSNLPNQCWLMVRTEIFKNWFGDWENDTDNASKVLDANGEPLIVWHGTDKGGFSVFDTSGDGYTSDTGAWFVSRRNVAKTYNNGGNQHKNIYPIFLNIRNPYIYQSNGENWKMLSGDDYIGGYRIWDDAEKTYHYFDRDGRPFGDYIDAVHYAEDIGSGRFEVESGGYIDTDQFVRQVWAFSDDDGNDYDGVIFKNIQDAAKDIDDDYGDVFVIRKSIQAKSATRNKGTFSTYNPDIYYQSARHRDYANNNVSESMTLDELDKTTPQEQIDAVRKQYEGTDKWLKAPNGKKSNLTEKQWLQVRTPNFKAWFGDWEHDPHNASKVVDENGEPKVVYHGTGRADRVGSIFRPDRATSGPMAFFSDSFEMAEGYSKNKADTSLSREELYDYHKQFTVEVTPKGKRKSISVPIADYWDYLTPDKRSEIARKAPAIGYNDDYEIALIPNNTIGSGGYKLHLREAKGNHLEALVKEWLDSGNLFNQEKDFLTVLQLAGIDNVKYNDPDYRDEAVYPVFINLRNPFFTSDISDEIFSKLERAALRAHNTFNPQDAWDADMWDKSNIDPLLWIRRLRDDRENRTTHSWTQIPDFVTNVLKRAGYDGIQDLGGKYNATKHNVYVPFKSTQIKSANNNNGGFNPKNPDIYYQSNPHVQHFDTFSNQDTETAYTSKSKIDTPDAASDRITQAVHEFFHGLKGDFPELAGNSTFTFAREVLRKMNRQTQAKAMEAVQSLDNSLKGLSKKQFNIFSRLMLINDLYTFKRHNPDAALPLDFTPETLKAERLKFSNLAQKDSAIMDAIRAELNAHTEIQKQLASLADTLGMTKFAEKVRRYDFYFLDYARLLGGEDINANYVVAVGETRNELLQDIERMNALLEIKKKHDIKQKLESQFGKDWLRNIPKGYKIFNPLAGRFIKSAHTLTENILDMALEQAGKQNGISDEAISAFKRKLSDNSGAHLLVLPSELADTLSKLDKPIHRGPVSKILKNITTGWKKYVLFFPTRTFKYNIRNLTGDLDAVIAGNPQSLTFLRQAMSELWDAYYGDKNNISKELREFQKRGGAITIQTTQELGDYKQLKEFQNLFDDLQDKNLAAWRKLPRKIWALIDKFAWTGVQNFSDFREQWLRYATYLSYLHQMQDNNGSPNNWGASVKDEVISLPDIRDRAFKMSNELLGAYDQVSETGRSLRDIAVPFYSWIEVNAKRYYQLFKNGITEDNAGDFASRFLKGELANAPYYAFKIGKTYLMINLLAMLIAAFNHLVWPDDEDKLPPDVQERPHITLGHDTNGRVLYFDRVGAMLDNLEWFGQDNSIFAPFAKDIRDIFDGRQTFMGFLGKIVSAPVNKAVNALNPFFKLPAELLTKKSFYPDATRPSNIRDRAKYVAQSLGLNWPYKAITGEPHDNWQEFKNVFVYSAEADEAAYFYTLSKVHEFQEKVLGRHFDGFASTQRGEILRRMKTALRLGDNDAVKRYLREYYGVGGSKKGLKSSMHSMNPMHTLSKQQQAQFLRWISPDEKKYINRAQRYFHKMADKFLR